MNLAAVTAVLETQELSHMPFLFGHGGRHGLIFARSFAAARRVPQYSRSGTTRIWRLAWTETDLKTRHFGEVRPLKTGLPGNEVECSPCLSVHGGQLHLSFIGTRNHGTGPLEHHLFRMSGPSLDQLQPAVRVTTKPCFSGFWRPDLCATAEGHNGDVLLEGAHAGILQTDFQEISRVSFDFEHPERLIITGLVPREPRRDGKDPSPRTIAYDVARNVTLGELQVDGEPVYKPTMCGGFFAHSCQYPNRQREGWRVRFAASSSLVPTSVKVRRNR